MRTPGKRRMPGAFRLDHPSVETVEEETLEQLEPVEADAHLAVEAIVHPPRLEKTAEGMTLSLPHIRLDQTLEFLIGVKLA